MQSQLSNKGYRKGNKVVQLGMHDAVILIPTCNNDDSQEQVERSFRVYQHVVCQILHEIIHLRSHRPEVSK